MEKAKIHKAFLGTFEGSARRTGPPRGAETRPLHESQQQMTDWPEL